jgi:hypothetical protein
MRTKVTLALLFLNVALFFFIVYLRKPGAPADAQNHPFAEAIANVQALEIAAANLPSPIRLEQKPDGWMLTEPIQWPANEFAVKRILSEVTLLRSETSFAVEELDQNGRSLADYGLEKPSVSLTVTAAPPSPNAPAPPPIVIRIGDTALGNRLYVLSPDGKRVHVVNRSLAESLSVKLEDLRSDEIFSIKHYEARSISIQPIKTRIEQENGRWSFGMPIVARASKAEVEVAINQLNSLRTHTFVDEKTDAARTGLNAPTLRITIDGRKRHETLLIGAALDEQPAQNTASPAREYYAQMDIPEKRSPVFTTIIPTALLDTLRGAQETLRERRILDFDPSSVTGITLSQRDNESELVLQRLDPNQSNRVPAWQYVYRTPSSATNVTPADREIVQRLLKRLGQLEAEKFVNNGVGEAEKDTYGLGRPVRQIALSLAASPNPSGPQAATIKLLLGTADNKVYAKLENAPHVYLVGPEILAQTSVEPLDYRERLLRELPAGAQITHLRLQDLSTDTPVFDTAIPAPTAATSTAPKERTPMEEVVARLRTLRAKAFVPGEFKKTVLIAGEERPWRYRLDASLALGGSTGPTPTTSQLFFSERIGGTTQLVGDPEYKVVFEAEQELLDALFKLAYGSRDPGPSAPPPAPAAAPAPAQPAAPAPVSAPAEPPKTP